MTQLSMKFRCPHCGQSIPPKLSVAGYIRPQIVELIAHRPSGITLRDIAAVIYSTDAGGKRSSKNVWLIIQLANRELKSQGYRIVPITRGPGARWVLREIDADPKYQPARDQNAAGLEGAQPARPSREH